MIRRGLIAGGAVIALLGVVYAVPRMMDWNRYRGQITVLATERLGRPVTIGGHVELTILPQPVLTAERISVIDPVTGAHFTARQMQLRVGLWGLLTGRIDPEALDLEGAVVRLPWPVPSAGFRMRPPHAFAAAVHDGTLIVGGVVISGIDGGFATYGDDGAVNAFGTAHVEGEDWGFEATLGAIDENHESDLSSIFTGQGHAEGAMLRLGGSLRDDGSFAGDMAASGPDLSRVFEAPSVPFAAEARIAAAGRVLSGSNLTVELGGATGKGFFRWQAGEPRFALDLALSKFDLDRWSRVWAAPGAVERGESRFDISADAAPLGGALLREVHLDVIRGRGLVVRNFTATLPGDTLLTLQGTADFTGGQVHVDSGAFRVAGTNLGESLNWISAGDGDLPRLPAGEMLAGRFGGTFSGSARDLRFGGLSGTMGGVGFSGSGELVRGDGSARVNANFRLDRLSLGAVSGLNLPAGLAYDLRVAAKAADYRGYQAQDVSFGLTRDAGGTRLSDAQATVNGLVTRASFTQAPDGTIRDGKIAGSAPALGPLLTDWPDLGWQAPSAVKALPVVVAGTFQGPPAALAAKITVDAGETELTALPVFDLTRQTANGTILLRNPGAWRLVSLLGGPDIHPWIGVGSLGLRVLFHAAPGEFRADYFDAAFGGMRLAGALDWKSAAGNWSLNGSISSERLPLAWPRLGDGMLQAGWVRNGSGKIALSADQGTIDDAPVASGLRATLALSGGVVSLSGLSGSWGGGSFSGQAAWHLLDATPGVSLSGRFDNIAIAGGVSKGTLDITGGALSGTADLTASGFSEPTWLATLAGTARISVTDGTVVGIDLAKAEGAVKLPGARKPAAALTAALKGGASPFKTLDLAAAIKAGDVSITSGAIANAAGGDIGGLVDLPEQTMDLSLTLHLPGAPAVLAHYKGPVASPAVTMNLGAFRKWTATRGMAAHRVPVAPRQHGHHDVLIP